MTDHVDPLGFGPSRWANPHENLTKEEIFTLIDSYELYDKSTLVIPSDKFYLNNFKIHGKFVPPNLFAHTVPRAEVIQAVIEILNLTKRKTLSIRSGAGLWEYLFYLQGCEFICIDDERPLRNPFTPALPFSARSNIFKDFLANGYIMNVSIDVLFFSWYGAIYGDEKIVQEFKGNFIIIISDHDGHRSFRVKLGKQVQYIAGFLLNTCHPAPHYSPSLKIYRRVPGTKQIKSKL
ncbi:MAG: hypothetical protein Harvfovirus36_4 [Harvfovirus sp.]|uniref:Uncharacterized protein n=1 Tax=Harvfovirus sp. TaxID=2487768 RepID=A0A3G5A6K6_9VIRU|nr:MAG: hypothetical protein Harvfovirus36_4 [Harvfovirus sp.]